MDSSARMPSFVRTVGVLALGLVVFTTPTPVTALRLICRDGDPNTVASPRGFGEQPFCNHDEPGDGVCTFGFYCLEVCGPLVGTVTVPVGETRIVQRGNLPRINLTQYTLRCLPSP